MQTPQLNLNETHKVFPDFEIQAVHLISARQLDLLIVNRKVRELVE